MTASHEATCDFEGATHPATWVGRSGRRYHFTRESSEGFVLIEGDLYLLAEGQAVRWVGSARDLIEEQGSRARFRDAVARGAAVYRMPAPQDDLARLTAVWDLECGEPGNGRHAA